MAIYCYYTIQKPICQDGNAGFSSKFFFFLREFHKTVLQTRRFFGKIKKRKNAAVGRRFAKGTFAMSSWKRGRDLIWKTFLYQIVMSFFGVMMYSVTYQNTVLFILGQIAVLAFYGFILVSQTMQKAGRIAEYDHRNHLKTSPLMGFALCGLGFVPTLFLSLINLIWRPFTETGAANSFALAVFQINKTFQQGMYVGLYQRIFPPVDTSLYAASEVGAANAAALNAQAGLMPLAVIPGILLCGFAYVYGYKHFLKGSENFSFRKNGREDSGL